MHRRLRLFVVAIIVAGSTTAYAVRQSDVHVLPPLHTEVIYFAHHLNARLEDSAIRRKHWQISNVQEQVNQMMEVFQTTNSHDDLVKEAVDVAVAAMMMAHTEGRKPLRVAVIH